MLELYFADDDHPISLAKLVERKQGRGGEKIRIISAHPATTRERIYEEEK